MKKNKKDKERKHGNNSKASRVYRLYNLPVGFFIARTRSLTENESKNTDWHQWSIYLLLKPKPRVFHLIYCSVALISIKPKV